MRLENSSEDIRATVDVLDYFGRSSPVDDLDQKERLLQIFKTYFELSEEVYLCPKEIRITLIIGDVKHVEFLGDPIDRFSQKHLNQTPQSCRLRIIIALKENGPQRHYMGPL